MFWHIVISFSFLILTPWNPEWWNQSLFCLMIFSRYITNILFVHLLQIYFTAPLSNFSLRYWHLRRFMPLYPNTTNIAKITRSTGPTSAQIAIFKSFVSIKYHVICSQYLAIIYQYLVLMINLYCLALYTQ